MGGWSLGFPHPNRIPDGLASPPELLGTWKVSPIAMGEEGLRPSTLPPFVKGGRKLYVSSREPRSFLEKTRGTACAFLFYKLTARAEEHFPARAVINSMV